MFGRPFAQGTPTRLARFTPMDLGLHTPEYWEARAEEARTRSEDLKDPAAKRSLLAIAAIYEHMARRAARKEQDQFPV